MSYTDRTIDGLSSPLRVAPTAVVSASPMFGVIGSVVRLSGANSVGLDGASLSYFWHFVTVPIGSRVVREGFRSTSQDGSEVTFSPDIVGEYLVRLTVVSGAAEAISDQRISIRAILVPDGRGLVPDGKFIWSYLRDVWQTVENKEVFESLWSALIQIAGGELLKLYQNDFAKSIRDIQDLYQRRWLSYTPKLNLGTDLSFILGGQMAGRNATTEFRGQYGKAVVLGPTEVAVVQGPVLPTPPATLGMLSPTAGVGYVSYRIAAPTKTGYRLIDPIPGSGAYAVGTGLSFSFAIQSNLWTLPSPATDLRVGDYVRCPTGANAGFYRITTINGSSYTVSPPPPASSNGALPMTAYRAVMFEMDVTTTALSDSFEVEYAPGANDLSTAASGRLIVMGKSSHTIARTFVSATQDPPVVVVTTDSQKVLPKLSGQDWLLPHTLISASADFDVQGVRPGDVLLLDVLNETSQAAAEIAAQVVGVDRNRLGFVVSDEELVGGQVPSIPNTYYVSVSGDLGIQSVSVVDGNLLLTDGAKTINDYTNSSPFQQKYANRLLPVDGWFEIAGGRFQVHPRAIIRNHLIPVDAAVRSIPLLQEWIVQPVVESRGGVLYQQSQGHEVALPAAPLALVENSDFILSGGVVLDEPLTFSTGSDVLSVEGVCFVDRSVEPGDVITITTPRSLKGEYLIVEVLSNDSVRLNLTLPDVGVATADVVLNRVKPGTFLRTVPGGFGPKRRLPDVLWAEVTFFDNMDYVEKNFGIMVGLSREDLRKASASINYRQAVAGLMFAYTRGSALAKVRLGAQILLGLPFAEHRGIIRSVENDYRLDNSGTPSQGRLLVEDVDGQGRPLGLFRSYIYPLDTSQDLSGLEVNPSTGEVYAEGDIVELFSALSKGAEVIDYLSNPDPSTVSTATQLLQQYHSIRLRMNDNIFKIEEMALVSNFLRRITPSYVSFYLLSSSEWSDSVTVGEGQHFKLKRERYPLRDDVGTGMSTPLIFDSQSNDGMTVLRWGNGQAYTARKSGRDLQANGGTNTFSLPGNVITPAHGAGPVARVGDFLSIPSGTGAGVYPLTAVTETLITVSGGPTVGFVGESGLRYEILRKVDPVLRSGTTASTSSDGLVVTLPTGLLADEVLPGDWLLLGNDNSATRYAITDVSQTTVHITPHGPLSASNLPYMVVRPAFIYPGKSVGTVTVAAGAITSWDRQAMLMADPGDELLFSDGTVAYRSIFFLMARPATALHLQPIPPDGAYTVSLYKKWGKPIKSRTSFLGEHLTVSLHEMTNKASWSTGGTAVALGNGYTTPRAGDLLQLLETASATTDVGYGAGVYPIVSLSAATKTVTVSNALGASGSSAFKIISTLRPPSIVDGTLAGPPILIGGGGHGGV